MFTMIHCGSTKNANMSDWKLFPLQMKAKMKQADEWMNWQITFRQSNNWVLFRKDEMADTSTRRSVKPPSIYRDTHTHTISNVYLYENILMFTFPVVSTQQKYMRTGKYSMDGKHTQESCPKRVFPSFLLRLCKQPTLNRPPWNRLQVEYNSTESFWFSCNAELTCSRDVTWASSPCPLCRGTWQDVKHTLTCRGHCSLSLCSATKPQRGRGNDLFPGFPYFISF